MKINGIEMVTDRTASDVEIAKTLSRKDFKKMTQSEKESFLGGLKGAYNYTDFNRVEKAVEYLSNRLYDVPTELRQYSENFCVAWDNSFDVGYDFKTYENVSVKTDWKISDVLGTKDRERYISNVESVVSSFFDTDDLPKSLEKLTHIGANSIEQYLCDTDMSLITLQKEKESMIYNTSKSWHFSGDLYGGEA